MHTPLHPQEGGHLLHTDSCIFHLLKRHRYCFGKSDWESVCLCDVPPLAPCQLQQGMWGIPSPRPPQGARTPGWHCKQPLATALPPTQPHAPSWGRLGSKVSEQQDPGNILIMGLRRPGNFVKRFQYTLCRISLSQSSPFCCWRLWTSTDVHSPRG